jgi:hypothetical protein
VPDAAAPPEPALPPLLAPLVPPVPPEVPPEPAPLALAMIESSSSIGSRETGAAERRRPNALAEASNFARRVFILRP